MSVESLSTKEISEIIKSPVFFRSKNFSCWLREGKNSFKISILAPKNVWKKAVDRNFVKRRVLMAFKDIKNKKIPIDLVIKCLIPSKKSLFVDLVKDAESILTAYNQKI